GGAGTPVVEAEALNIRHRLFAQADVCAERLAVPLHGPPVIRCPLPSSPRRERPHPQHGSGGIDGPERCRMGGAQMLAAKAVVGLVLDASHRVAVALPAALPAQVNDLRSGRIVDLPTRTPDPPAPLHVFAIHERALVHAP